jgi:hypothetical protein
VFNVKRQICNAEIALTENATDDIAVSKLIHNRELIPLVFNRFALVVTEFALAVID